MAKDAVDPKKVPPGPSFVPVRFNPATDFSNPMYLHGMRVIGLAADSTATPAVYEINVLGPDGSTFFKGASVTVAAVPAIYPLPPSDNLHLCGVVEVFGASTGLWLMVEKVL